MRAVKHRDTKPEWIVRRLLFRKGYRYRLHGKDLPGKPDIVFGSRRKVIFVHGCFWHGHSCKRGSRQPKTNSEYWREKISRNMDRHARQLKALSSDGWSSLTVWECQLGNAVWLENRLEAFLDGAEAGTR